MGQFCKNTVMCEGRDKRIQRAQLACLLVLTVLASLISASELSSAPAATAPFFGEVEVCIKPSSARDPEQPYDITIPTAPTHQSTHGNMATHHHALCPLTKKKKLQDSVHPGKANARHTARTRILNKNRGTYQPGSLSTPCKQLSSYF